MALPAGPKEFLLGGKQALVIGAEHPVGRVAAVSLAEAGAKMLIASQEAGHARAMKETAKAVEAAGQKSVPTQVQHAAIARRPQRDRRSGYQETGRARYSGHRAR